MLVRLMNLPDPNKRRDPMHCIICQAATKDGKTHCSEHIEHRPYVKSLLEKLAERDAENELVRQKGKKAGVAVNSITAKEILMELFIKGPRTEERLCRELNLELGVLQGYIQFFKAKGKVSLGHTNRGSTMVTLIGAPALPVEPKISEPKVRLLSGTRKASRRKKKILASA